FVGFVAALVAIRSTARIAHTDRINVNSWETYRAYNSNPVRAGRALAQQILHDTKGKGLPTYEEYLRYFGHPSTTSVTPGAPANSPASAERQAQRQYLHDLAAFYHQTGTLLAQGHLDREFTLLIVGPGLEDRWPVMQPLAGYYERPVPAGWSG